jgi:hypothetical protein
MNAEALEQKFDAGEDVLAYFDRSTLQRPSLAPEPVEISFPKWMVAALDHEAQRLGIQRDAVIKLWLAERLKAIAAET